MKSLLTSSAEKGLVRLRTSLLSARSELDTQIESVERLLSLNGSAISNGNGHGPKKGSVKWTPEMRAAKSKAMKAAWKRGVFGPMKS